MCQSKCTFIASCAKKKNILVVGGGGSHDFNRWYKIEDTQLINTIEGVHATYTDNTDSIRFYLKTTDLWC
ncbi:hypothetical protein [Sphingobacterium sp. IITKGP-BTPF85]|uniref:hypothetical protein n=1 Tax=Sphingobacterium sp. IITKGP-BTPF85 TaxID=1338009 RepID=UPI000389E481|nr:hypothetical protein [Sphingobacterium sp. IITKGP-BTPF85]KKX49572.1 hypothetical protein L950_0214960 [Sphingobacterium sp. IITKGP-BTPF85]